MWEEANASTKSFSSRTPLDCIEDSEPEPDPILAERGGFGAVEPVDALVAVPSCRAMVMLKWNSDPRPGSESARRVPPTCSMILATTAKPRPVGMYHRLSEQAREFVDGWTAYPNQCGIHLYPTRLALARQTLLEASPREYHSLYRLQ